MFKRLRSAALARWLPFLAWFPIGTHVLRADAIAGITGALVLVPKAMAYAQLSGLPVHFGLYVAFVPAILGALWGSSRQLATGPVAIISLMTAAALAPLAMPFTDDYIELALLLTLLVGAIQFALGVLKLGTIVNFVSHPVILGFMNAAAIIIAASQLDMLLGIPKPRSDWFLKDVWEMAGHLPRLHWPTVAMAAFALALMLLLKRVPRLAQLNVLIAVIVTTVVSWAIGFERNMTMRVDEIADPELRSVAVAYAQAQARLREINAEVAALAARLRSAETDDARVAAGLRHALHVKQVDADDLAEQNKRRLAQLQATAFVRVDGQAQGAALYAASRMPAGAVDDGRRWRMKKIEVEQVHLMSGGEVVGRIPQGLPEFRVPKFTLDAAVALLPAALVIALVGFIESIAMAKALAAKTRQRLDPNQELVGQGVANLGGAFFQSYPACGSFTGSAINLQAGAQTGFAMVFNGLFIVLTLLLLTPTLYHLPKATLAVIILLAVVGLVTPGAIRHAWQADRADGWVALATFVATLVAAPHLDKGIVFGAALAVIIYLWRTMRPRVALLGRHPDGALRDARVHPQARTDPRVIVLRFDASLYFANAAFFEEAVLEALAEQPQAKCLLIVGSGINRIDASGEEVLRHLVERLHAGGLDVVFSSLKKQVRDVIERTGLAELIGRERIFPNEDLALAAIDRWLGADSPGQPPAPPQAPEGALAEAPR